MAEKRKTQNNPLVHVSPGQDRRAYDAAIASLQVPADVLEQRARAVARRFGVDENLSPRDRCMAIARKMGMTGTVAGMFRAARDRVPGEDDE